MTTATATAPPREAELVSILRAYNDVTERLKRSHDGLAREVCRLRKELQQKNKELQRRERLAGLGAMAAGVAHEIRNPLGGIQLFASLLDRDLTDRPTQRQMVRKMSTAIHSLEKIVSDILAFAGDAGPNRRRVLAGSLIDAALGHALPKAEGCATEILVDADLTSVPVFCDAVQMERALANLIFNALDAAGPGGHVWIRRVNGRSHGYLWICVADDGPGIAPDVLDQVFDPFVTTKDTGTGLGLAIVHRIAESNGGAVRARNRRGGGAAFELSIPLGDEAEGPAVAARKTVY